MYRLKKAFSNNDDGQLLIIMIVVAVIVFGILSYFVTS